MKSVARCLMLLALVLVGTTTSAFAGRIVVANDEWQFRNDGGFAAGNTPADSAQFARNIATFFNGGLGGNFLVISDGPSLDTDSATALAAAMTGAGHIWTDSEDVPGFTFTVANLLAYDGVFFGLPPDVDQTVLINYVNAGGNVYVHGGTGVGGGASEAADWNTFLNAFGLNYASAYNGIGGKIPIVSSHQVLAGVDELFQNNGNTISLLGTNPYAQIIASSASGAGLYAVVETPEPATMLLVGTGLAFAWKRRRARRG